MTNREWRVKITMISPIHHEGPWQPFSKIWANREEILELAAGHLGDPDYQVQFQSREVTEWADDDPRGASSE